MQIALMHTVGVRRLLGGVAVGTVCVLGVAGCSLGPELDAVAAIAERTLPADALDRQVRATVREWMLTPTSLIVYPFHKEAGTYLSTVRRVDVQVYKVKGLPRDRMRTFANRAHDAMVGLGMQPVAVVRERHETVGVFMPSAPEEVQDLFVVVLNRNELVLARARCNLERLLKAVLNYRGEEIFNRG